MNIQWGMNWLHSDPAAAKTKVGRDAFADPLERPEWEDLGWAVPLISRLVSAPRARAQNKQKIQKVQRFTAPAAAKGVCIP